MATQVKADRLTNISQFVGRKYENLKQIENDVILFYGGCDFCKTYESIDQSGEVLVLIDHVKVSIFIDLTMTVTLALATTRLR